VANPSPVFSPPTDSGSWAAAPLFLMLLCFQLRRGGCEGACLPSPPRSPPPISTRPCLLFWRFLTNPKSRRRRHIRSRCRLAVFPLSPVNFYRNRPVTGCSPNPGFHGPNGPRPSPTDQIGFTGGATPQTGLRRTLNPLGPDRPSSIRSPPRPTETNGFEFSQRHLTNLPPCGHGFFPAL